MKKELTEEVYNLCENIDSNLARIRARVSRLPGFDLKSVDRALNNFDANSGRGQFLNFLYREVEKRKGK
jgi:hypothetical protein